MCLGLSAPLTRLNPSGKGDASRTFVPPEISTVPETEEGLQKCVMDQLRKGWVLGQSLFPAWGTSPDLGNGQTDSSTGFLEGETDLTHWKEKTEV